MVCVVITESGEQFITLVANVVEGMSGISGVIAIALLKNWGWPTNTSHMLFRICLYTQVDPKMLQLTMEQAREVCVFCIHAVTFAVEIGIVSTHYPSNYCVQHINFS